MGSEDPNYLLLFVQMAVTTNSHSLPIEEEELLAVARNYIFFVQLAVTTNSHSLPIEEEELLQLIGVQIIYLPKMRSEIQECNSARNFLYITLN
jgi:hypothetical protein